MDMYYNINFHGLCFSYPDSFHLMEEEERSRFRFIGEGESICLLDPEQHMLLSMGWKQTGGILSLLVGAKDLAKDMEKRTRQPMKEYGYHMNRSLKKEVGEKKAFGFSYEYFTQGTYMTGESYVVKAGKDIYSIHVYMRTGLKRRCFPVWEEILGSISWV